MTNIDPTQMKKLESICSKLKTLIENGPVGPRAASTGNTLTPTMLLDLVWELVFGRPVKEMTEKDSGAQFVLSVWKGNPVIGWHLHNIQTREIVMVLATTIAMVGKTVGSGIIEDVIAALQVLKEQQELEEATDGSPEQ